MASGIKVRINAAGARDVLRSGGVASYLDAQGAKVEASANSMVPPDETGNPPFARSTEVGLNRARCIVSTANPHGVRANNKRNILIKSLGGG